MDKGKMNTSRIKVLRKQMAVLKKQSEELSRSAPSDIDAWRAYYEQHKREYRLLDRDISQLANELRKLEWPDGVDIRLYRALRSAGFETWCDVTTAAEAHGLFWFRQFRNIGISGIETIERLRREGITGGEE